MYKKVITSAVFLACAGAAFADGHLPPPPTTVYVPPQVQTCNPTTLQVYFKSGESVLTQSARRSIEELSETLDGCALAGVTMVSFAADGRSVPESETLAESRLFAVSTALADRGLAAADTEAEITARERSAERNRPLERRVEVTLAAYRPEIG